MKKLLALIMAIVMLLSFAACAQTPPADNDDDKSSSDTDTKKDSPDIDEDKSSDDEDVELEDIIEGTWLCELELADTLNEYIKTTLETQQAPDDLIDAIKFKEFNINIELEFDKDEVTLSMSTTDPDDIADQFRDDMIDFMKDYLKEMGETVTDAEIEEVVDDLVEDLVGEIAGSLDDLPQDETSEYEIDGDKLVIDGDDSAEVTVINKDEIEIEFDGIPAELEQLGVDSVWTFERD